MATSAAQLAAKFHRVGTTLPRAEQMAITQAVIAAKQEMIDAAVRGGLRPGAPLPKSGTRPWGVTERKVSSAHGPAVMLRYRGPVHWQNSGVKAHGVTSTKLGFSRRVRSKRAMEGRLGKRVGIVTPQGVRSLARPGGYPGRRFWPPAREQIIRQTPRIIAGAMPNALIRAGFGR